MMVKNRVASTDFFVKKLGFQLVNENLIVKFPPNSPNNFGVPHNFSDAFEMALDLYSPDGTRDTMCESIECKGLIGHDYSERCHAPNRGILSYRIEVEDIKAYLKFIKKNKVAVTIPLSTQSWNGFGKVKCFTVKSPDGAWVEFFEQN
jgi:catechol 2,3-dioxygenase-like lactoylglutathione lyase family enzyme